MWVSRMKGGFYGLKVAHVSLILIGFVCIAVLVLAWTKTTLLTTFYPPRSHVLHLMPAMTDAEPNHKYVKDVKSGSEQLEKNLNILEETNLTKASSPEGVEQNRSSANAADVKQEISPSVGARASVEVPGNVNSSRMDEDFVTPRSSLNSKNYTRESSSEEDYSQNSTASAIKPGCNLMIGKWVIDENRPLYSGFGCKQWLSSMWACRLTQRTDFEYEKLLWRPKYCEMKEFTGANFLRRMQNKTLAFVGDSLGRQQFQSMMCMITGGEERHDVLDVGKEYGLVKARGATRPGGWAYRFQSTNTTVLYYWSASLCDLEPLDLSSPITDVAMHMDRPPAFLSCYLHKIDVLVLNTGHHWNRGKLRANRWIMYVGGVPNTNRKIADIAGAKNFTIHSIVGWVNSQLPKYPGLKAFYRSISPRHFFNGDWNTGGTCDNTTPLSGGKEVVQDEPSDPLAAAAVKGTGVKLLDITALSQLRDEGHISRYSIKATPGVQDCLHWCLPGVPDTWNEILFAQI